MRKEKIYRIHGYHEKQMDTGFDDVFVNEKGLESFKEMMKTQEDATLEEENTWCIGYDLYIKAEEFKVEIQEDFKGMRLEWSDGGYDDTWLYLEHE